MRGQDRTMTDKGESGKTHAAEAPPRRLPRPLARPPGALSPLRPAAHIVRPMTHSRSGAGETARASNGAATKPVAAEKRLVVGRDISLSGEIASCDRLVVEGRVEAKLSHCRELTVVPDGVFKGTATIDDAEIRGRFEGTLTARKRLVIRSGGSVSGTIRYGAIEVERGARLSGDVQAEPREEDQP
jgi:cytoskeletal protein CcmA (bactofilin family)